MAVRALDHVNICTPDVASTARFFADILGMKVTASPGSTDLAQAAWIRDDEDRPIIHLASPTMLGRSLGGGTDAVANGSGRIHHVALRCEDYDDVVAKLKARGADFRTMAAAQQRVLFVVEENGILLELNFLDS